ncbi:MAG: TrmB family transcriptional regulator [Nitrososphaerota archaeon]
MVGNEKKLNLAARTAAAIIACVTKLNKTLLCPVVAIGMKRTQAMGVVASVMEVEVARRSADALTVRGSEVAALLESLGVSEAEERVYRALLRNPTAVLSDLAIAAGVSQVQLRRILSTLKMKGLISRSVRKGSGYAPVFPDVAVEGLIHRRQEELEQIRSYLPQLRKEFHNPAERGNPMEFVEVVSGRRAVARRFAQLQRSATETILTFDKPPYAQPDNADGQPINQLEFQRLAESVQYRAIYSAEALAVPGRSQVIHAYVKAGELARVAPDVPMKLAIADRRLAIMPFITQAADPNTPAAVESAVVFHQSSLLDALVTLFEEVWERALLLPFATETEASAGTENEEEENDRLLALLTAGLTDEVIARQLGISVRTVRRRVRHLMDHLGAVSRFQAGLQAAKRGWV